MSASTPRGQQTRQRLLEAAEVVFGEQGFERASIVAITRRAGVAQGTFYLYFSDKKAVFVELVHELSRALRREIAAAVVGCADRLAIERSGFQAFFRFACSHRNLYKIVRQAEFVDEEVFRWYYRRMAAGYALGLARAMGDEQSRRVDCECLAYCLMGIGDFLGMRWALWEGQFPPEVVFETMMVFVQHGMAAMMADGPSLPEQGGVV